MIEMLESAGLGFYVKATETQQKLGELGMVRIDLHIANFCFHSRQDTTTSVGLQSAGATSQHASTGVRLWSTHQ